jgi:hypothetical protein
MATIFFYESSLNKEFLQTSNPSLVGKSFVLLVSKVKILKISSNQKQESSMVHVAMFLPDQDEMRNLCKGPHKHHL